MNQSNPEIQKAKNACHEILKDENKILSKDECMHWLAKHEEFFNSFELPPIFDDELVEFHSLYYDLKELLEYLTFNDEVKNAVDNYNSANQLNEEFILQWLTKNEELWNNLFLFMIDCIEGENEFKIGYFQPSNNSNLKVAKSDFENLIKFKKIYSPLHYEGTKK